MSGIVGTQDEISFTVMNGREKTKKVSLKNILASKCDARN